MYGFSSTESLIVNLLLSSGTDRAKLYLVND